MKKNSRVIRWLWQVTARDKGKIFILLAVRVLSSSTLVLSAWLLRAMVDSAVAGSREGFWQYTLFYIALILGKLALLALNRHFAESCRSSLENRFKNRLFGVLLRGDHGRVTAVHSGEWMNRLTSDTMVTANAMTDLLPGLCGMVVQLLGALSVLLFLVPQLRLICFVGGTALLLSSFLFRKKLKALHKQVQEADGDLRTLLTEGLGAMLVIKAFGKQETARRDGEQKTAAHRAARMKKNRFSNLCNIGFGALLNGATVLGAAVCGYGILTRTVTYGTFTATLQLIGQIQTPFANLSGFLPLFYGMIASAERLMEAEDYPLDCPESSLTEAQAQTLYEDLEAITLENVSFAYPGEDSYAAQDLDLHIKKGEYVAFTGPSGCGKSTALKLLLALYPVEQGRISLRTPTGSRELTAQHRTLFSYVPQGNALMSGTIRQVLTFGAADIPEQAIWQALRIACADDFVRQLDKGLDAMLMERGSGLSEGQMQRLAIARAILSNRPILLLDEATSALDEATEAAVLKNLQAMTHRTVAIVTHRPAALEICHREVSFG